MTETQDITSFTGRNAFLSNFFIEADGLTAEHRFQASKTAEPDERENILSAPTPGGAKQRGKRCTLAWGKEAWNNGGSAFCMEAVLRKKFSDPTLAAALKATGDATLIEGNRWHDNLWGSCLCPRPACAKPGQNRLGKILMAIRDEM